MPTNEEIFRHITGLPESVRLAIYKDYVPTVIAFIEWAKKVSVFQKELAPPVNGQPAFSKVLQQWESEKQVKVFDPLVTRIHKEMADHYGSSPFTEQEILTAICEYDWVSQMKG